jgi:secreted PhoX family phosphatase
MAVAAATPSIGACSDGDANQAYIGKLLTDPDGILDLPTGFEYRVVATQGEEMDDGLLLPARADGMAAFAGDNGRVILICNHENPPVASQFGPFGVKNERLKDCDPALLYDYGNGETPGTGGTTTIVYDPQSGRTERRHLSLGGTEYNCAGGPTPWGSWLSCEETFEDSGPGTMFELPVRRERKHGYVFEVPASATGMVEPVPLRDMGRFEHEACAVDPDSGVVFLTEDKHRSLFYRFIPTVPGKLAQGGQLQALVIADRPSYDTRNWSQADLLETGQWLETSWVDIEEPDSRDNDLRLRGFRDGAARFARGEGLCYAGGSIFVTCTIGGPARLGQVFEYRVSTAEGTADESLSPGKLRLLAEATTDSLLRNADNLTMSPWGDLIVCEDTADHCGLVGIRPDGIQYRVADNSHTDSELAGVCFSPDGSVLFVNIQERGLTLAITGPWPRPSA